MKIHIEWGTGYMNINVDKFFPCPINNFKKLLKVIDKDWEHKKEIKRNLEVYFQERLSEIPYEVDNFNSLSDSEKYFRRYLELLQGV